MRLLKAPLFVRDVYLKEGVPVPDLMGKTGYQLSCIIWAFSEAVYITSNNLSREPAVVITSSNEKVKGRKAYSRHYKNSALDFRTRLFSRERIDYIEAQLIKLLSVSYDVVVEKDHIHIEYDPPLLPYIGG